MSRARSPSTGRPDGGVWVCEAWGIARSTVDAAAARGRPAAPWPPAKRGPKTGLTDEPLVAPIRRVLGESPFTGEGHRKVWARLRYQGIRTSKARVRRWMREHGLLAPSQATRVWGPRHHTLKEQRLWVHTFRTVEELRLALRAWLATYNAQWLIERHGHRSPAQVRRDDFDARRAA
jgi:hypothetical protein